jgi:nucleoside 2-deoxyribosyltransferase
MGYKLKCFLSYAHVDREFVREEIVPVLLDHGIDVWIDYEQIEYGSFIVDSIIKGIRQADIIIAVFNRRSTFMNFEVGAAIGQNKPTIAIVREDQGIPGDLRHISFLRYSEKEKQRFNSNLRKAIGIITDNVIDKSIFEMSAGRKVIGVRVGVDTLNFEEELRFTADFLSLIKELTDSREILLLETAKGTFKSFFSIDLKSWADLIEKILFFIPEWQKKKAESLKIQAETKKIEAEAEHLNTTSRIADDRFKIEHAEAMANLLLKYKDLGVKVQFDNDLLLSLNPKGLLLIKEPEKLE